ncbi:hypothetical protein ACFO1B_00525 [Dactylosporangium siamense]|uniref:Uncharacterized protein n=1 Tax=Dactylosporangium siamense TaxID=685454 RepID=A0A919PCD3_9ACTN|nr:hypothetical protein [Dactylosporangium siamense]GIG42166.1 hypothetical protein Dsi01nite_002070 [Dactylosporangium siamense]
MSAVDRVAEGLLRLAARRWPADVRAEQAREWAAELHELRTEPGPGAGRRALGQLRFALSLAAASPVEDEDGVPRGWREGLPGAGRALQPMAVLVVFGILMAGPGGSILRTAGEWILGLCGVEVRRPVGTAVTVATSLPPLLIGTLLAWWLGRRRPVRWAGLRRLGTAGPAAVAPVALAVSFVVLVVGVQSALAPPGNTLAVSLCVGATAWTLLAAALAVGVVRLARWRWLAAALALIGTPLVVELAIAAAVLPGILTSGAGPSRALGWAPSLVSGQPFTADSGSWQLTPDALALFNATSMFPAYLLLLTGIAVGYGLGAARPGRRHPEPLPAADHATLRLLPVAAVAGVVAQLAGVLTWAYTLAVLTPELPLIGQRAPMPGGDGELYMWGAELRWAGITLGALSLVLAAADRRAAPLAAAMQTVVLLVADGILARADAAGPDGLRIALTVAAAAAALSWGIAGRRGGADALAARRRLGWTAVTAACCGPILFAQGTPAVNHPFLPSGLAGATATLAAMFAVVAVQAAAAARPVALTPVRLAVLTVAPAVLLGAGGALTGAGVSNDVTGGGLLLSAPMMVLAAGILRGRRARSAIWITLVLASPALSALVGAAALILSMFVANLLFAVAGSSWAADGLSLLPGAVVLALIAGVAAARTLIRPGPDPLTSQHPDTSMHLCQN